MVSKHLLVNRADLGVKYYTKLRDMVGPKNFFPTIIPFRHDKYWDSLLKVRLGGREVEIPGNERIETDSKYRNNKAKDVVRRNGGHSKMTHVYINKVQYKVKEEFQDISEPTLINEFTDLPGGDTEIPPRGIILHPPRLLREILNREKQAGGVLRKTLQRLQPGLRTPYQLSHQKSFPGWTNWRNR